MHKHLSLAVFITCTILICLSACTPKKHKQQSKRNTYIVSSSNVLYECTTPYNYRLYYCDGDTLHFETYDEKIGHVDVYIFPIPTNSIAGYMQIEISKNRHLSFFKIKSKEKDVASYHIREKVQKEYSGVYTYVIIEGTYSDYLIKYITKGVVDVSYLSNNHFFTISDNISGKQHSWDYRLTPVKEVSADFIFFNNTDSFFTTYSNYLFSLRYPKSWNLIGKVNDITDIYIGDADGKIGFTIVCVETNNNLSELIAETKRNLTSENIHILSEMEMTLCNVPCHLRKYTYNIDNKVVFQEQYLLKKGHTMYSITFGNNEKTINDNKILIREIIKSLKISAIQ